MAAGWEDPTTFKWFERAAALSDAEGPVQRLSLKEVMAEVVLTLQRTEQFSHCQVMGVLFAQDLKPWNERKRNSCD